MFLEMSQSNDNDARSSRQRYRDQLRTFVFQAIPAVAGVIAPGIAAKTKLDAWNSEVISPREYGGAILPSNAATSTSNGRIPPFPARGFQTKSGLKYFDLVESSIGNTPRYGEFISFLYTSYYRPSRDAPMEIIDSTEPGQPFLQKHGNGRIIRGLEETLHTMHVGAKRRIIVPPKLGFSQFGLGPLPVDPFRRRRLGTIIDFVDREEGELIYDVELVAITVDDNDQGLYDDVPVSQDEVRNLVKQSLQQGTQPEINEEIQKTTPKDLFKGM